MKLTCISQYHPAASLHNPRLWAVLLDDWQNLPTKVNTDYRVATEAEIDPDRTPIFALDTETDGKGGLGQWSVAWRDKQNRLTVCPMNGDRHIDFTAPVIMHNAKYDLRALRPYHIKVCEGLHDTLIAAYCLGMGRQAPKDNSKEKSGSDMVGGLGLKYLARRHLGMQMRKWEEVADHPELQPEYNMGDSVATFLLFEKWLPILPRHYFEVDMPLLSVCMGIEDRGIEIDPGYLTEFGKELDNKLATYDLPLNPFARAELMSLIYGELGFEPWKFTETGEPSVDDDVLETINEPIVQQILEYKRLYKERGTYVTNYFKLADLNNRIHPELKQTSTSTRRLSCARPNLQNVFKKDERVKLRSLFRARQGCKLIRLDYNQLDFRALAAITQDPLLIAALNSGKKIHDATKDEMGIGYDYAKIANFAAMFKAEAWTVAQQMGCTIGEARAFLTRYFEKFPNIKKYHKAIEEELANNKNIVTIPFENSKRRIDAMFSEQWRVRQEGLKEAVSTPVQGVEAYVVKRAMIDLHHRHAAPMTLQVHDELLFEIEDKHVVDYAHWLKEYVPTTSGNLGGVEFPVEVGIGDNWYQAMQKENVI